MRKLLVLVLGLAMTSGILLAQSHSNATEHRAKVRLTFTSETKVGTTVLKADDYEIYCDRETITFVRVSDHKKMLEIPCTGTELSQKQEDTRTETTVDKSGMRVLRTLIIEGSNVKHTFD